MNNLHFKDLLLKEQDRLIEAMSAMGTLSGIVDGDWEVHKQETGANETETNMLSSQYEEESTNEGVLETLEERLNEVTIALGKIDNQNYGKCESCNKNIEEAKLEANPAAKTCISCSHI
jgi:DnaK suppressor protein